MKYDVIIVGAGAAGLMAAKELSSKGYCCCLLEASSIAGGRIATIYGQEFGQPAETGAEFIHGKLPLTMQLLREAAITYTAVKGKMIFIHDGKEVKDTEPYQERFLEKVPALKQDTTLSDFLNHYFPGEKSQLLRESVQHFAEGFDLADARKASVFALRDEWQHEFENQFRIDGGYSRLIEYLLIKCIENKTTIHFNSVVSEIKYNTDKITVNTKDGKIIEADKLILTVSAAVLQSGMIKFTPHPSEHFNALYQLGFGAVIKILFGLKNNFPEKIYPDTGFFISNEAIPTWWTQLPAKSNLLTGWLGGPAALQYSSLPEEELLQIAVSSLAAIFNLSETTIKKELLHYKIICWQNHQHIKGGYSYSTIHSNAAKIILSQPVQNKIFFAGEAIWNGESQGTVEAALQSGLAAAKMIIEMK